MKKKCYEKQFLNLFLMFLIETLFLSGQLTCLIKLRNTWKCTLKINVAFVLVETLNFFFVKILIRSFSVLKSFIGLFKNGIFSFFVKCTVSNVVNILSYKILSMFTYFHISLIFIGRSVFPISILLTI